MRDRLVCSLLLLLPCVAGAFPAAATGGWIEPYADVRGIRSDLRRYGLSAGVYVSSDGRRVSYLLRRARGSRPVPLLLYIAGSGEVGGDLSRQFAQRTLFELVCSDDFQSRHPCHLLVLSPPAGVGTLLGGRPGSPTDDQALLMSAVDVVSSACRPPVDTNRLYATGLSFGGNGVLALASRFPGRFAAVIPVSSLPPDGEGVSGCPSACWLVYSEGDYRRAGIAPSRLADYATLVRLAGGEFRFGGYPGGGHDAWSRAWREEAVWDWMFSRTAGGGFAAPPPVRSCTASVPGLDVAHGPSRAVDGLDATCYVSARPMGRGDWWVVEYGAPVEGRVYVLTGTRDGRNRLASGRIEVSADGQSWTWAGRIRRKTGTAEFTVDGVRFLRVRPDVSRPEVLTLREVRVEKVR